MKVLFVYPFCGLGGVEMAVVNKMRVLRKIGIESEVLFSEFYGDGGKTIMDYPKVKVGFTDEEIMASIKSYDLIFVIDYPDFILKLHKMNFPGKVIFETHISAEAALEKMYAQIYHDMVSAVVVPSMFNQKMIQQYTRNCAEVFVLPNPVDIDIFHNIPFEKMQFRYQQFLNKRNIIWIGRLEANKNTLEFLKIVAELLKREDGFHFIIVGDWIYTREYKQMIDHLLETEGIGEYVTIFQNLPNQDMPQLYSLAANTGGTLVSTSKNESLPMIFLEAMACRCPVLTSAVGGVGELIQHNYTGKVYQLGDLKAAVQALQELCDLNDQTERKEIIDNAFGRAMKHSLEYISFRYKQLFTELSKFDIKKPRVSIVMSVYNGEAYVVEAIESILTQTYHDFEFIIIDDCSTDRTPEILHKYQIADRRIRVIKNIYNQGVAKSLNKGLHITKGEYIARMDADDISEPKRLEEQVQYLDVHLEVALVGSWYHLIDEASQRVRSFQPLCNHFDIYQYSLATNPFCHGSIMGRKSVFQEFQGYDPVYEPAEDYHLWLQMMEHYQVNNIPQYLYQLRRHHQSVSVKAVQKQEEMAAETRWRAIKRRGIHYSNALGVSEYWEDRSFYYTYREMLADATLVIYGADWTGEKLLKLVEQMHCRKIAFLAEDWGQVTANTGKYSVYTVDEIARIEYDYVVITDLYWYQAKERLINLGVDPSRIIYGFYIRTW